MSEHPAISKYLILGASGFVGRALVNHLQANQSRPVIGYSSKTLDLSNYENLAALDDVIDDQAAALVVSGVTLDAAKDSFELFTRNMAMLANTARYLEHHRPGRIVYFSTVSVYGDTETNLAVNESTPVNTVTYYAAAKFAGECLFTALAEKNNIPLLILRLCRIYGPGAVHANYGPVQFIRNILREGRVSVYGDGREVRDQFYIGDLVRITQQLIESGQSGTFNTASGESYSFEDILRRLRDISQQAFEIAHLPRSRPRIDQRFDISKLKTSLPGFRFTPFQDGLKQTYEDISRSSLEKV